MSSRSTKSFVFRNGINCRPRSRRVPQDLRSLLRLTATRGPESAHATLEALSFNTGRQTTVFESLFEPVVFAAARTVVAKRGGKWRCPAGECRTLVTDFDGSALIALEQASCRKALGIAAVTWSESQASFVWGELHRASEDGERRFDAAALRRQLSGFSFLPRMGTFVWPPVADCLDRQGLFLVESTFWLLGLAMAAEHLQQIK
jgi:hypothetical protein